MLEFEPRNVNRQIQYRGIEESREKVGLLSPRAKSDHVHRLCCEIILESILSFNFYSLYIYIYIYMYRKNLCIIKNSPITPANISRQFGNE